MRRVLVISDDVSTASVLEHHLPGFGYFVVGTLTATPVALPGLAEIALLDLSSLDAGVQACRDFKAMAAPPAVLLMTRRLAPAALERARAAGADAILVKPIHWDNLVNALERLRRRH